MGDVISINLKILSCLEWEEKQLLLILIGAMNKRNILSIQKVHKSVQGLKLKNFNSSISILESNGFINIKESEIKVSRKVAFLSEPKD